MAAVRASRELCSTVAAVGSGLSLPMWIPTGSYMVRPASLYWVLHGEAWRKGRLASGEFVTRPWLPWGQGLVFHVDPHLVLHGEA